MEYQQLIQERHSVRSFSDSELSREIIDEMIQEALLAPSSKNVKSSGFMVIDDKSVLEAISEMRESGCAFVKDAAAAVVVLGDETKADLWRENASISATYLLLSAADRGLGGCWVHVHGRKRTKDPLCTENAEDYLRALLGVKDNMRILCVIALGYPEDRSHL